MFPASLLGWPAPPSPCALPRARSVPACILISSSYKEPVLLDWDPPYWPHINLVTLLPNKVTSEALWAQTLTQLLWGTQLYL